MSRRWATFTLIAGLVLAAGAVGFRMLGASALVRYPTDVDKTLHYSGTYTSYFDEETSLPREEPLVLPFALDRHLDVVDHSFSTVVIAEELRLHIGDDTLVQHNQYVMDRRSMELQGGADSWAFTPENVVDRSGSYRVQFPMGVEAGGDYRIWNNETERTTPLVEPTERHDHDAAGVEVVDFEGNLDHEVSAAYRDWLAAEGFPMEITPAQLQAQLALEGIDVAAALADVSPLLTPDESAVVGEILTGSVPLVYSFGYHGQVSLEAKTGTIMDVHVQHEGLAIRPDLSGVSTLQPLLDKYSSVPSVKALNDGLVRAAARPATLAADFEFTQTPASSRDVGNDVKDQIRMMRVVNLWVPWSAGLIGVAAVVVSRRRRGGARDRTTTDIDLQPPPTPREPVRTGP